MFNKIKQKAYDEGFNDGQKIGYDNGYSEALKFATQYYEEDKQKQPEPKDEFRELESFFTWIKSIFDIADSDYFRSYLFENTPTEDLVNLTYYLDYLEKNDTIKQFYPYTTINIPELLLSLREVYDNRMLLEQAKLLLKG